MPQINLYTSISSLPCVCFSKWAPGLCRRWMRRQWYPCRAGGKVAWSPTFLSNYRRRNAAPRKPFGKDSKNRILPLQGLQMSKTTPHWWATGRVIPGKGSPEWRLHISPETGWAIVPFIANPLTCLPGEGWVCRLWIGRVVCRRCIHSWGSSKATVDRPTGAGPIRSLPCSIHSLLFSGLPSTRSRRRTPKRLLRGWLAADPPSLESPTANSPALRMRTSIIITNTDSTLQTYLLPLISTLNSSPSILSALIYPKQFKLLSLSIRENKECLGNFEIIAALEGACLKKLMRITVAIAIIIGWTTLRSVNCSRKTTNFPPPTPSSAPLFISKATSHSQSFSFSLPKQCSTTQWRARP